MFEQILNLITRGIVALETIASHYQSAGAAVDPKENGTAKKGKARQEPEDDQDEGEEDETPKTRSKKGAAKESKSKGKAKREDDDGEEDEPKKNPRGKKPSKDELRDEIKQYAAVISGGDDDEASDEFSGLLEDFGIKSISKLDDADVEEFHGEIRDIVNKYFE